MMLLLFLSDVVISFPFICDHSASSGHNGLYVTCYNHIWCRATRQCCHKQSQIFDAGLKMSTHKKTNKKKHLQPNPQKLSCCHCLYLCTAQTTLSVWHLDGNAAMISDLSPQCWLSTLNSTKFLFLIPSVFTEHPQTVSKHFFIFLRLSYLSLIERCIGGSPILAQPGTLLHPVL